MVQCHSAPSRDLSGAFGYCSMNLETPILPDHPARGASDARPTSTMASAGVLPATPWQAMFERLLATMERRDNAGSDQATETYLPAAVYRDPHRHQAELSRLFRRLPLCLGHVDQLPEAGSCWPAKSSACRCCWSATQRARSACF
jgi:hypothetical protein